MCFYLLFLTEEWRWSVILLIEWDFANNKSCIYLWKAYTSIFVFSKLAYFLAFICIQILFLINNLYFESKSNRGYKIKIKLFVLQNNE